MILAAALMLAGIHERPPATTTSSWLLEPPTPADCTIRAQYDSIPLTLGIEQRVASREATIVLIRATAQPLAARSGSATLTIDNKSTKVPFSGWPVVNRSAEAIRIHVDAEIVARLKSAKAMKITTENGFRTGLQLHDMQAALAMLQACGDRLLRRYDIDPSKEAMTATPPQPIKPNNWLRSDDFPKNAGKLERGGQTISLLTIADDGGVRDCRAVASSGSSLLDQTACDLLPVRARFKPALDAQGHPIESHIAVGTNWIVVRTRLASGPALAF